MRRSQRRPQPKNLDAETPQIKTKRRSQSQIIETICKSRLDALEQEETYSKDNTLTLEEKKILLEAYYEKGFPVFQDTKLLNQYLPNRREADLKGLIARLAKGSSINQVKPKNDVEDKGESQSSLAPNRDEVSNLDEWQDLSRKLITKFAQDRKVAIEDVYGDVMMLISRDESVIIDEPKQGQVEDGSSNMPNPSKILASFGNLLQGKFPERPTSQDAAIMMRLFDDLNQLASRIDLDRLSTLSDGSWLAKSLPSRRAQQKNALEGLNKIDGKIVKGPSMNDIDLDSNLEALCLELPKIKRITDALNPLHIDKATVDSLFQQL